MSKQLCRMALKIHRLELLAKDGVVAVGIGKKSIKGVRSNLDSIVCSVKKKKPLGAIALKDFVPGSVAGAPTDVIEVGEIRALALPTDRFRPAPGGVSIGHVAITAGTLGCVVRKGGKEYILSNNHVLANSNAGAIGDEILQPGPHDGGVAGRDTIGTLSDFVRIKFLGEELPSDCKFATAVLGILNLGCHLIGSRTRYRAVRPLKAQATENLVDCALALPAVSTDVLDQQFGLGQITGIGDAEVGTKVVKSGRTTGVTRGEILQTDVSTQVQYGAGQIALFVDQIMAGPISAGGDSGSAVLDEQLRFVGLLFAGSESVTIIYRAQNVLLALGIER